MNRITPLNLTNQSCIGSRCILVVDDEPAVANAVRRALLDEVRRSSRTGCSVDVAETAEGALALALVHRYDVVLTDYEMPGRNGVWLLEQMKERFPETLRVLHSGSNLQGLEVLLKQGVVQRIIQKPASLGTLALMGRSRKWSRYVQNCPARR